MNPLQSCAEARCAPPSNVHGPAGAAKVSAAGRPLLQPPVWQEFPSPVTKQNRSELFTFSPQRDPVREVILEDPPPHAPTHTHTHTTSYFRSPLFIFHPRSRGTAGLQVTAADPDQRRVGLVRVAGGWRRRRRWRRLEGEGCSAAPPGGKQLVPPFVFAAPSVSKKTSGPRVFPPTIDPYLVLFNILYYRDCVFIEKKFFLALRALSKLFLN